MQRLEQLIERVLWSSRLVVLVAVAMSVLVAFGTIYMSAIDALQLLSRLITYAGLDPTMRSGERTSIIAGIVKTVDGFLIAAIALIFALGLYELFINKIDVAKSSEATLPIQIRSFDHLKDRVAKMILLALIVEFFQYALRLSYASALDLLYLSLGILLIGGALYLTKDKADAPPRTGTVETPEAPPALERRTNHAADARISLPH